MTDSNIAGVHPSLVLAYRQAIYGVLPPGQPRIEIRINSISHELAKLMKERGVGTAALLTAFNPRSKIASNEQNQCAQALLLADLGEAKEGTAIPGEGSDPEGKWPSEHSVLALGIPIQKAHELAKRYEQNGFVWVSTSDALCTLRLNYPLMVPSDAELFAWRATMAPNLGSAAAALSVQEQAALMTVPSSELAHWLLPQDRDLTQSWPLTRPDGSAMGSGSEFDRLFRLISAGLSTTFGEYVSAP